MVRDCNGKLRKGIDLMEVRFRESKDVLGRSKRVEKGSLGIHHDNSVTAQRRCLPLPIDVWYAQRNTANSAGLWPALCVIFHGRKPYVSYTHTLTVESRKDKEFSR